MGKLDIEEVEKKILAIVQAKFAAKVAEINADKGDTLLVDIPTKNYLNNFYEEELTSDLFIWYGIDQPESTSIRGDTATTWTIFYKVFVQDRGNLSTIRSKILRYTRAFMEIFQENNAKIRRFTTIPEITALTPEDVQDIMNDTPYKMGGVEIKIIIA